MKTKTKPATTKKPKYALSELKNVNIEGLIASEAFKKLPPTDKLVAMLKVKPLEQLIAAGLVYNAKIFGERVGYSYDHVRRLARAGKIKPEPVMLGNGKVWREYYFLPEHIDAVFAQRPL